MIDHKYVVMVPLEDYKKLLDYNLPTDELVEKLFRSLVINMARHIEGFGTLNGKEFAALLLSEGTSKSIIDMWKQSIKELKP